MGKLVGDIFVSWTKKRHISLLVGVGSTVRVDKVHVQNVYEEALGDEDLNEKLFS